MADTDQDIFDQATAPDKPTAEKPADTPAVEEQPETPAQAGGPERDPATGKFVAKAETEQAAPVEGKAETVKTEAPKAETQADHRIPLAEHLNEREKRQAAETRASTLERELQAMNRRLDDLSKPKAERPDIWADPQAFVNQSLRDQIDPVQKQQEAIVDRFSRLLAVQQYTKPVVEAAFAELETAVRTDPAMRLEAQRIWQQEHPYGALVDWHKQRQALKEFGSDPNAYKAKVKDELMKDPEFRAAIIAAVKAESSNGQQNLNGSRPNNVTRLPPSLGRVASAAPNNMGDETDPSDAELFRSAARSK